MPSNVHTWFPLFLNPHPSAIEAMIEAWKEGGWEGWSLWLLHRMSPRSYANGWEEYMKLCNDWIEEHAEPGPIKLITPYD